jgi:hypothetical protein
MKSVVIGQAVRQCIACKHAALCQRRKFTNRVLILIATRIYFIVGCAFTFFPNQNSSRVPGFDIVNVFTCVLL